VTLQDRHPRLHAERFFWAVLAPKLPAHALRRTDAAATRVILDEAFAPHLPVEVTMVAPAYTPLSDGTVLACGLPASSLGDPALAGAVTLAPGTPPIWLDRPIDLERLNVLTGAHEPGVVTIARRLRSTTLTAAATVLALGVGVGFERRTAAARADADTANAAMVRLTGSPTAASVGVDPSADFGSADLIIDRELTRLRAARGTRASVGLTDASDSLAALLAHWPRNLRAQVQTVSATPNQLTVGALLPAHADAEDLSAALTATVGWDVGQPQINTVGKGVQVQLTLKPSAKEGR